MYNNIPKLYAINNFYVTNACRNKGFHGEQGDSSLKAIRGGQFFKIERIFGGASGGTVLKTQRNYSTGKFCIITVFFAH